jgi:hypothetical protein
MVGVVKSLLARDDLNADITDDVGAHVFVRSVYQGHDIVKLLLERYFTILS